MKQWRNSHYLEGTGVKIATSPYWFWTSSNFYVASVAVDSDHGDAVAAVADSGHYCCQDSSVVATSGSEVAASFARSAAADVAAAAAAGLTNWH